MKNDLASKLRRLAESRRPIPGERLGLGPDSGDYGVTSVGHFDHLAIDVTTTAIPPDLLKSDKPSGLNG